MPEVQQISAEEVVERIRANIRRRRRQPFSPFPAENQLAKDLATARASVDVYSVDVGSPRRLVGKLLVLLKSAVKRLLAPVLQRQIAYNEATARIVKQLRDQLGTATQREDELRELIEAQALDFESLRETFESSLQKHEQALREQLAQRGAEIEALRGQVAKLQSVHTEQVDLLAEVRGQSIALGAEQITTIRSLRERVAHAEQNLRRLGAQAKGTTSAEGEPSRAPRQHVEDLGLYYCGLEERFRGSEAEIKERQRIYLEYFVGRGEALDLGCGRGEFLELARENGFPARGVDRNLDMVLCCREHGLDVAHADIFAHLEGLPDKSLDGIFSAQVIEHFEPLVVVSLLRLCHRKLRAGGVLVLETINPECPAGMNTFYIDPTHEKPLHPAMLRYSLEWIEFEDVRIRYIHYGAGHVEWSAQAEEWSRVHCPDYAAIARK
jgi:O-antigen chain-terminating methyltransferase